VDLPHRVPVEELSAVAHDFAWVTHHSGFIPGVALIVAVAVLLRLVRRSIWQFALVTLPGTIAHEGAHLIVGMFLGANPSKVTLWPKRVGKYWQLGAVTFGDINLANGMFVTMAPLMLLPLSYAIFANEMLELWSGGQWGWWLLTGYLTGNILFAAMPSAGDFRLGARSIVFWLVLLAALAVGAWLLRDL